MKPSEVLAQIRDVLDTRGWTQHAYMDRRGRRCLLGAVAAVQGTRRPELCAATSAAVMALEHKIAEMYPDSTGIRSLNFCPGDSISVFNDAPGRTLQEIFDLLDKTRIGLEEKGQ
ncbi:hypothetical protein H7K24_09430 [Mycobacterium fragae]|jgi:hypothetical protein|uniref:Uncharacterized protein n=1 Tax=Mycobacterium fragae TaxID=1260918 RepID=A0A1X1V5D9_9MYCO|nr:hypothetical protein [Mycobacterium fragae]MCV7400376.1 hypothetical protein [Mycobacterium fragae]ORV64284.1 hypothetical protein AWC06_06985 [Mycobacterium fragae]